MDKLEQKIRRNEKINRTFVFTAKIKVKEISLKDASIKGGSIEYTSRMIYLIPEVSTQSTFFFDAWLPTMAYKDEAETQIMHHEIAVVFPSPIFRALRCAVSKRNKNYPEDHHLVVMTSEAVEEVLAGMDGMTIEVKVLPDMEGEAALG